MTKNDRKVHYMYTYENLKDDVAYLGFNGVQVGSIGSSVLGNELYYIKIGDGKDAIIITGGIHARENVTALLVIRQAFKLLNSKLPFTVYFIPMLNPDGAVLIERGASGAKEYSEFVRAVNGSDNFSLWKANIRAVDLNVNFDAKFGRGKSNIMYPAPQNYVGEYAFSEPETAALRDFTLEVKPIFTVSYHALGQEVYWDFGQTDMRNRTLAYKVADLLGYKAVDGDLSSTGGYKDWCILNGIPALTIEIGDSAFSHPLSESDVEEDIMRNLDLPVKSFQFYNEIYKGTLL